MAKKGIKVLTIILIIASIIGMHNTIYAGSSGGLRDINEAIEDWKPRVFEDTEFNNTVNNVVGLIRLVGIVISVITFSIIGIKFLVGSAEEKAQYKQTLIPWLIGAILIFAITTIPSIIYDITKSSLNSESVPERHLPDESLPM